MDRNKTFADIREHKRKEKIREKISKLRAKFRNQQPWWRNNPDLSRNLKRANKLRKQL